MAPPILKLDDIHLTFGATPLLEGADLRVHEGDRLCLVGRNGSGKSTLMKIAAGMVEPDEGEIFVQPGVTWRYLPQEPDFSGFDTALDYVLAGLAPGDEDYRAPYLLESLGLTGEENPAHMSGGEMRRAALARVLAPEPDILLLDEPTNHLDLPAIEWLEAELQASRSALVLISHDRRFLENLSRKTVWIDRGQTRELDQSFAGFEDWRDELLEREETEQHKLERKIHREQHWIVHGVSGRRKRNMRRVKELAALRQQKKTHRGPQGTATATVAEGQSSGKRVAELKNVSKSYGDQKIVTDLSLKIARGDRLGLVGPNGSGKTTLIKLITGAIEPDDGTVELGVNLQTLFLDQTRESLNPEWTLREALTDGAGDLVEIGDSSKHVMSYMKDFLFLPEQAGTVITKLSGGERGRLQLARQLRKPSNFLILDEPTNDLDLETLDLLQEILADYAGTVLLVSHDRDFLDRVVTSVLVADNDGSGRWTEYAGGYTDMLSQRGKGVESKVKSPPKNDPPSARSAGTSPVNGGGTISNKQQGQVLSPPAGGVSRSDEGGKQKSKLSFKQKFALENLPKEMDKLRSDIAKLKKVLSDPELFSRDPDRFNKAVELLAKCENELSEAEDQWLELEMLREELEG